MEIIDGQVRHHASAWLEALVPTLANQARQAVDAHTSVVVRSGDDQRWVTATSAAAGRCDAAQDVAGGGPRALALIEDRDVVVDDVVTCARWPGWARACADAGVQSVAVVLGRHEHARVALSVHRDTPGGWPPHQLRRLSELADAIALLWLTALEVESVTRATEDSLAALGARAVIDQALGVIMAQNRCDADTAFDILRTASMHRNAKLRVVATEIVTRVSGRPPRVSPFQPRASTSPRAAGGARTSGPGSRADAASPPA
ncbi:ANTAR domain-containing protein [Cellulomonas dongxiuzhuiae]|uniref:ANTAR domain-containing protein n=1 Tax=Cellulomonas dongxiuzhuiae TaxID=2819979 RepID=A0ABX8GNI6_9CELL|nr:ANTAR domain-containing protein [Cellulomonas dongxiuzhuiae]MBO3093347.1 GAF and ANTAR domain-containing protein [Cellulomonas dongxiuzhuiae]QWC17625.1 ANTAR domain-containing protein [Cellulomonas dongxiuzhuiae]